MRTADRAASGQAQGFTGVLIAGAGETGANPGQSPLSAALLGTRTRKPTHLTDRRDARILP